MTKSGFANSAADIISSSDNAYSMVTAWFVERARYKRWESELCAVQRNKIFMVDVAGVGKMKLSGRGKGKCQITRVALYREAGDIAGVF